MKKFLIVSLSIIFTTLIITGCSIQSGGTNSVTTVTLDSGSGSVSNGQTNVSLSPTIVLKFSNPVDPTTVNSNTVFLSTTPNASGAVAINSFTSNISNTTFHFSPATKLNELTTYYIIVTNGVDPKNDTLLIPVTFNFKTADFTSPTASIVNPNNGQTNVSLSPSIQIQFSEAVLNVESPNVQLHQGSESGPIVAIGAIEPGANNTYTFNVSPPPLNQQTTYFVVLTSGITDTQGNALTKTTFNFTTGDFTAPTANITTPSNNQTGVAANTTITIQFSEAVQNVNNTTFTLHRGSVEGPTVSGVITGATDTFTFTPNIPLESSNTAYFVVLTGGITDLAGNPLTPNPTTFNFTTAPLFGFNAPSGIDINFNGNFAYITNFNNSTVTSCDLSGRILINCVSNPSVVVNPIGTAINNTGESLFIASSASSAVASCTVNGKAVSNCIPFGTGGPSDIAISRESSTLIYVTSIVFNVVSYCTLVNGGQLNFCSTTTGAPFGAPSQIVLNESGTLAYVANNSNSSVTICNVNGTVFNGCVNSIPPGLTGAWGMAINSTGTILYITSLNQNQIFACDVAPDKTVSNCTSTGATLANSPSSMIINPSNTAIFWANTGSNNVISCAVNGKTLSNCVATGTQ